MLTLIKLGGSLITDKNTPRHFRQDVMHRIAAEIHQIIECAPSDQQLIIGHGSGSFGHIEAKKYNTINGATSKNDWLGFTRVANAAAELSQLVTTECVNVNLPVMRFQPSASIKAQNGDIIAMNTKLFTRAVAHGLIPMIHGDVAFDSVRGGTIVSTETIFSFLVKELDISRIVLLGEVDGVLDTQHNLIPHITPKTLAQFESALKGSSGVDVTGGMYQKVMDMLELVKINPDLKIIIANGKIPDMLQQIICENESIGTCISSD